MNSGDELDVRAAAHEEKVLAGDLLGKLCRSQAESRAKRSDGMRKGDALLDKSIGVTVSESLPAQPYRRGSKYAHRRIAP